MTIENNLQTRAGNVLSTLIVEFYAWVIAIAFGAILLDVMYANLAPEAAAAFSEVADFLPLLSAAVVFAAILAVGLSWRARTARYLFIASLMIIMLEFLIPAFFAPLLQGSAVATAASASILSFVGLNRFYRHA